MDVRQWRGLNNVADPLRLGLDWLVQADNCDVTQTRALVRAEGFTKRVAATQVSGAYATQDLQRLYLIDAGTLYQVLPDHSKTPLRTGLSAAPYTFDEVNGVVFFANGHDYGVIDPDGARPWGIEPPPAPRAATLPAGAKGMVQAVCTYVDASGLESANSPVVVVGAAGAGTVYDIPQHAVYTTNVYVTAPDGTVFYLLRERAGPSVSYGATALGRELPFWNMNTPRGSIVAHFQGRVHIAEVYPELDQTAIWRSLPLHYHHFDPGAEALIVPGTVRLLKGLPEALLIGTERAIYAFTGDRLELVAPYGVVPGWHAQVLDGAVYFWSLRGLCRALPFQNLTQGLVSVPPGLRAGGTVIERDGYRRYVVALQQGGEAYNNRQ